MVMRDGRALCRGEGMDTMNRAGLSRVTASKQFEGCFAFAVPNDRQNELGSKLFRDPIGPQILRKVAHDLQRLGFHVTEPKPGKACDAGFEIRFDRFDVTIILLARRQSDRIKCVILTWLARSLWRRSWPSSAESDWTHVCDTLEQVLRENTTVTALERLTRTELTLRRD